MLASAAAALFVAVPPAMACSGPYPSFREAVTTAQRVVIGDVISTRFIGPVQDAAEGWSTQFMMRIRWVLRGKATPGLQVDDRASTVCGDYLAVRLDDRIALALHASREPFLPSGPPIVYSTAAWIRGTAPEGAERISVSEAFRLLGLEPPPTSTAAAQPISPARAWQPVALLAAAALGLALAWVRRRA